MDKIPDATTLESQMLQDLSDTAAKHADSKAQIKRFQNLLIFYVYCLFINIDCELDCIRRDSYIATNAVKDLTNKDVSINSVVPYVLKITNRKQSNIKRIKQMISLFISFIVNKANLQQLNVNGSEYFSDFLSDHVYDENIPYFVAKHLFHDFGKEKLLAHYNDTLTAAFSGLT